MNKEELMQLYALLRKFRAWLDEQDAESIRKASTIRLAGKLCEAHEQNDKTIQTIVAWVASKAGQAD
jgi:hypothetical protein